MGEKRDRAGCERLSTNRAVRNQGPVLRHRTADFRRLLTWAPKWRSASTSSQARTAILRSAARVGGLSVGGGCEQDHGLPARGSEVG